jgi:hypothetical protein
MAAMESTFWDRVAAEGQPPNGYSLTELTTELTTMLGDPDPRRRDTIAYDVLASWVSAGVYDDLLEGLGDGMTTGLTIGLGEDGTDTVFRRSFSALVLGECIDRDTAAHVVPAETVLGWGDRLAGWFVRERDLRGYVPGKGWAHTVAHGADALGALAGAEAMGRLELTVVLDVVADRLTEPTEHRFLHGEDDRLAAATMAVLRRDALGLDVLEPWLARLADAAVRGVSADHDPYLVTGNVQAFLRALHLQLALGPRPPACRSDLLLTLIDRLRQVNPHWLS